MAGGVIVKDQQGYDAATQLLFCFFCVWRLSSLCVQVIPTLKKMKERKVIDNQPKHLCHYRLGPAILLCMKNYISVYKLQEETYLYRWRRGRNGSKTTGCFQSGSSSRPLKIDVFYVPFVSLYKQCVFVRVLASPVCLSSYCNPSLCVGFTPLCCLSVHLQLLPFSLWVWPSPFPFVVRISVHLFLISYIYLVFVCRFTSWVKHKHAD